MGVADESVHPQGVSSSEPPVELSWRLMTNWAPWLQRSSHAALAFDGRIWILGGQGCVPDDCEYGSCGCRSMPILDDVWCSADGVNWVETTEHAPWLARYGHSVVEFSGRIWILGGIGEFGVVFNDVWSSANGKNWEQSFSPAPWAPRYGHASVVFDDRIWILGGADVTGATLNDVWWSVDGETWIDATAGAVWAGRLGHTALSFDDKLWILGGAEDEEQEDCLNDIWFSDDGLDWVQAPAGTVWTARTWHSSVTFNERMWIFGGQSSNGSLLADIWHSGDGEDWSKDLGARKQCIERCKHVSVVFDNRIWVIGGDSYSADSYFCADVWRSVKGPFHSGDYEKDDVFSLEELLRVIQFYQYGVYQCYVPEEWEGEYTEDGYDVGPGDQSCAPHSSDYAPQDWSIDLIELMRLIQLYNMGGYHPCEDSAAEDGFCPGAG